MYKYMYVRAATEGVFRKGNYKDYIDKYSREGWRFVASIPVDVGGAIHAVDLVFEKEID